MTHVASELVSISVTPSAMNRIKLLQARSGLDRVLCVSVTAGGCSGRKYKLAFSQPTDGFSILAPAGEPLIAVDPASAELLDGCAIDFVEGLSSGRFKISSPSVSGSCKCGESFQ